jgi:hypothetical protein
MGMFDQIIPGSQKEAALKSAVETRCDVLLELIRLRFEAPLPDEVCEVIKGTNDLATLSRWFRGAVAANSLAEFRATLLAQP